MRQITKVQELNRKIYGIHSNQENRPDRQDPYRDGGRYFIRPSSETFFFPDGDLNSEQVRQDPYFIFVEDYITEGFLNVVGTIFISSLKMLVVPLVFISLVCGTSSLSEPSKLGRLGGKTLAFYLFTTAVALTLSIMAAVLLHPGHSSMPTAGNSFEAKDAPSLAEVLINIVPTNPMQAMSEAICCRSSSLP